MTLLDCNKILLQISLFSRTKINSTKKLKIKSLLNASKIVTNFDSYLQTFLFKAKIELMNIKEAKSACLFKNETFQNV